MLSLKGALRETGGHNDKAAVIARLHLELDHVREREILLRAAVSRSEDERGKLVEEAKRLVTSARESKGLVVAMAEELRYETVFPFCFETKNGNNRPCI